VDRKLCTWSTCFGFSIGVMVVAVVSGPHGSVLFCLTASVLVTGAYLGVAGLLVARKDKQKKPWPCRCEDPDGLNRVRLLDASVSCCPDCGARQADWLEFVRVME
jgi:hypothetical protein